MWRRKRALRGRRVVWGATRAREENPGTQAPGAIIGAIRPREAGTHINGPEWSAEPHVTAEERAGGRRAVSGAIRAREENPGTQAPGAIIGTLSSGTR